MGYIERIRKSTEELLPQNRSTVWLLSYYILVGWISLALCSLVLFVKGVLSLLSIL